MKKMQDIFYKLERREWAKKAKEKGFLIYRNGADIDDVEIDLLEKQMYKRASVFIERIEDNKYQANYTKWDESGALEKVTVLIEGRFEKCFKEAVKFIKWLDCKKNSIGKKSEKGEKDNAI